MSEPAISVANALPIGARVLFREGRFEQVGTVVQMESSGMVRVLVGSGKTGEATWKLIPVSQLSLMPSE